MRHRVVAWAVGIAAIAASGAAASQAPEGVRVVIRTDAGEIEIEVDTARAPITGSNFLRYVDAGSYTEGVIYRVVRDDNQPDAPVKIDVIQGRRGRDTRRYPPIPLERTSVTGLTHADGVISMARAGPDTGTSEFFICVGAQPQLDYGGRRNPDGQGFAAFGRVIRGMEVVRAIHGLPADGQQLQPPVRILGAERVTHGH